MHHITTPVQQDTSERRFWWSVLLLVLSLSVVSSTICTSFTDAVCVEWSEILEVEQEKKEDLNAKGADASHIPGYFFNKRLSGLLLGDDLTGSPSPLLSGRFLEISPPPPEGLFSV